MAPENKESLLSRFANSRLGRKIGRRNSDAPTMDNSTAAAVREVQRGDMIAARVRGAYENLARDFINLRPGQTDYHAYPHYGVAFDKYDRAQKEHVGHFGKRWRGESPEWREPNVPLGRVPMAHDEPLPLYAPSLPPHSPTVPQAGPSQGGVHQFLPTPANSTPPAPQQGSATTPVRSQSPASQGHGMGGAR